ncbi:MAG: hypothetical protein QF685_10655 [Verrucomicrobiota bacterium]|jgi:hypothetical protein|nr:hypothetical protein [Verrucomicrobiota bacterium]
MKGIAWVVLVVLGSVNLWAQEGGGSVVVNRVLAVVGGTRVITMQDLVEYRDVARDQRRLNTADLILGELVNDALLIQEVYSRKGFVVPAGLGEDLLARHMRRMKQSRSDLVRELQQDGITLEQFERQLIDKALLASALDPIRESVQVSPRAISEFSETGLKQLGRGSYAVFLALQIPASEEGINAAKVKALVDSIKSADDFRKLAKDRKVVEGGLEAKVYFDEKYNDTWHIDAEVTATLYGIKAGKADVHPSGETYHVMFVTERGEQEKPNLNDPRVRELIKGELSYQQYTARLNLKLQKLKREINVYRPSNNN